MALLLDIDRAFRHDLAHLADGKSVLTLPALTVPGRHGLRPAGTNGHAVRTHLQGSGEHLDLAREDEFVIRLQLAHCDGVRQHDRLRRKRGAALDTEPTGFGQDHLGAPRRGTALDRYKASPTFHPRTVQKGPGGLDFRQAGQDRALLARIKLGPAGPDHPPFLFDLNFALGIDLAHRIELIRRDPGSVGILPGGRIRQRHERLAPEGHRFRLDRHVFAELERILRLARRQPETRAVDHGPPTLTPRRRIRRQCVRNRLRKLHPCVRLHLNDLFLALPGPTDAGDLEVGPRDLDRRVRIGAAFPDTDGRRRTVEAQLPRHPLVARIHPQRHVPDPHLLRAVVNPLPALQYPLREPALAETRHAEILHRSIRRHLRANLRRDAGRE